MKNLKKLSVAVMLAALFSTSFTSCIDGEVSPVVEAIYAAQADLLAAQAAVQEAEADLLAAQAAAEQAQATLLLAQAEAAADVAEGQLAVLMAQANLTQAEADLLAAEAQALADLTAAEVVQMLADADYTAAETAYLMAQAQALADLTAAEVAQMMADAGYTEAQTAAIMAETAAMEAMWAEQLATMIEMNDLAVQEAQAELMMAQEKFEAYMQEVMLDLIEAGADLAEELAEEYAYAMSFVNSLKMMKNVKEGELANKEIMLALGEYAPGMYLAHLEAELAALEQSGVDAQNTIDELNAYLANPSAEDQQVLDLQAANADLVDANAAIDIAVAELNVTINEINAQMAANTDLQNFYNFHKNYRDTQQGLQDALIAANAALQADVDMWQTYLDNYDATTTTLTDAKNAAQAAAVAAQADEDAAEAVEAAALTAYNNAHAALLALEADLLAMEGNLNTAAALLATTQASVDAGTLAAATAAATADVATAQANVTIATATYELWRDRFEGGPTVNGGYWWEDGAPTGSVLGDDLLGLHTDASGAASTTYAEVTNWTYVDNAPGGSGPEDRYFPQALGALQPTIVGLVPGPTHDELEVPATGIGPAAFLVSSPAVGATRTYFVEIGLDDVSYDNLAEFQAATVALGAEEVFDTPPYAGATFLGNGVLGGDDAYIDLWDAQVVELNAMAAEAAELQLLADRQAEYDRLKAIFENELALLDAAQALDASTWADYQAAAAAENALEIISANADAAYTTASNALSTHLGTTKAQYQAWIDANLATIAANDIYIAEYQILIDQAQADMDDVQAEIDALALTPLMAQLIADKHVANDMIAMYMAQKNMNMATIANNNSIIAVIGTGSLTAWQIAMDAANATLAGLPALIHVKEVQILMAGFDLDALEADIANCEEEIADLEANITAAEAYAAGVWALLQEALAS